MVRTLAKLAFWFAALIALAAFITAEFLLDRPPAFAFEQAANHFYRKGEGLPRETAAWLIESGLVQDWAESGDQLALSAPYPLLLLAATSNNQYPYQRYSSSGQPLGLQPG